MDGFEVKPLVLEIPDSRSNRSFGGLLGRHSGDVSPKKRPQLGLQLLIGRRGGPGHALKTLYFTGRIRRWLSREFGSLKMRLTTRVTIWLKLSLISVN